MATFTELPFSEAERLVSAYAIGTLQRVDPIPAGSVNSNFKLHLSQGSFFLRIYEEQGLEGAQYDADLLEHLAKQGVPSPRPVVRRDGASISQAVGKPAAIFPFVEGEQTCQRAVDEARCLAVGEALARVHVAGRTFPTRRAGRFQLRALVEERRPRIAAASDASIAVMADELPRRLDRWLAERAKDVPEGVIHGDLFRDNVLFERAVGAGHDRIAALLDFESASDGRFVYDIAVTILAWCVGDSLSTPLAAAIVRGYERIRALEPEERAGLRAELALAAIRFTTTRITDYALRAGIGARVIKDWRRFLSRLDAVERLERGDLALG